MRPFDIEQSSDEELLRAFAEQGDKNAITSLLRRHEARVYGLAYRLMGNRNDAADATQEAFLLVVRKARSFKYESAFTTWLFRIVTNACHDLRRKTSRAAPPTDKVELEAPDPSSLAIDKIEVENALASLIKEYREVVVMRDLAGMSYQEIAEVLRVPVGTVKSRIARGRMALAEQLGNPLEGSSRLSEGDG